MSFDVRRNKKGKPVMTRCKCTACGSESQHTRYELKRRAARVRCDKCGGNVVEARYAQ